MTCRRVAHLAGFMASAALCEPRGADFVASAAPCEPRRADFVAAGQANSKATFALDKGVEVRKALQLQYAESSAGSVVSSPSSLKR